MSDFRKEFPDYPVEDMPVIPVGFVDSSWVNNAAPSFECRSLGLSVWIDYKDPSLREYGDGNRFIMHPIDAEGAMTDDDPILETSDWLEVLKLISTYKSEKSSG